MMQRGVLDGYLLDTNIASPAFDAGHPRHGEIRQRLQRVDPDRVFICPVTVGEIEWGLRVAYPGDTARQLAVRRALAQYKMVGIDRHTAEEYSVIRASLFAAHAPRRTNGKFKFKYVEDLVDFTTGKQLGIQENDLWIVSVAVQHNLIFATNDHRLGMTTIVTTARHLDRTEYW